MGVHDLTFYDVICRNAGCFGKKEAWVDAEERPQCHLRPV